jgi:hypothetical protein
LVYSSRVTGKKDGASEDGGCFALGCAGGEGIAKGLCSGTAAGLGAHGGDSALEEEMAIGGVEDDFSGGGGSEAAGEKAVGVGENLRWGVEEFGWFEGCGICIGIYGLGAIDDKGDLDRCWDGGVGGGENLA